MKTSDDPTLFQTLPRQHHEWLLPVMILASISLHGLCFYLVQSSYPMATRAPASRAAVSTLNPGNPADQKLLTWINQHDPSLMAGRTSTQFPPDSVVGVPFQPSYTLNLPQPRSVLEIVENSATTQKWPVMTSPGAVESSAQSGSLAQKSTQPPPPASVIRFSEGLAVVSKEPLNPPQVRDILPEPTQFLCEIDTGGHLLHAFLQKSSGVETLDTHAAHWLARNQFQPASDSASRWGTATIFWGMEIFAAEKK